MLDTRNRPKAYRKLAEECRRLAASAPSTQIKNRYLLMAQDYMWGHDTPATVEENAAWTATMTGRFPGPWRIVEIPHGFAVDDATGQQLAVFYASGSTWLSTLVSAAAAAGACASRNGKNSTGGITVLACGTAATSTGRSEFLTMK
jgi:hypothetical protein